MKGKRFSNPIVFYVITHDVIPEHDDVTQHCGVEGRVESVGFEGNKEAIKNVYCQLHCC